MASSSLDTRVACGLLFLLQLILLPGLHYAEYGKDFNIAAYDAYIGVTIMMLVGFGYLMAFLKRYGLGAVGFTFIITALAIELNVVLAPLIPHGKHAVINSTSLVDGDFAAATVLITFGCIIGKASPAQLVVITVLESLVFQVNRNIICVDKLGIADTGGTIIIHMFGAYFGLACAYVLGVPAKDQTTNESATIVSDLLSLIGTVFLWIYWPSFNGAADFGSPKYGNVCVTNTVIALCASCVASFALSGLMGGRFTASHVQNATLAGGVAVGAIARLEIGFAVAAALGMLGGMVSTVGYHKLQPYLLYKLGLHDSCGVHNLHGLPGLIGSFASVFAVLVLEDGAIHEHDKSKQATMQLAGTIISFFLALASGAVTGLLVKHMGKALNSDGKDPFQDSAFWVDTDDSKYAARAYEIDEAGANKHPSGTSSKVSPSDGGQLPTVPSAQSLVQSFNNE